MTVRRCAKALTGGAAGQREGVRFQPLGLQDTPMGRPPVSQTCESMPLASLWSAHVSVLCPAPHPRFSPVRTPGREARERGQESGTYLRSSRLPKGGLGLGLGSGETRDKGLGSAFHSHWIQIPQNLNMTLEKQGFDKLPFSSAILGVC